jgi:HAD superfamily hydrolase (TIGR01509 family)
MSYELTAELASWRPDAVVFDCDGLLIDTEPCWTVAETELFARRGLGFGPEEKAFVIGKSVPAAAESLAELFNEPGTATAIAKELLVLVEEVVGRQAEAMAGAAELVEIIKSKVPVAVASNSPRGLLDAALRRAKLTDALPMSIAADEVEAAKPAPDMYLAACAMLGMPPERCLAFEDSMTGLRSARAAGLRIVGIPTLAHVELTADVVFPSLLDDRLLSWIEHW